MYLPLEEKKMKNILLPTDFSACAKNATYAALELAAAYRAKLHLFTNIDLPKNWTGLSDQEQAKDAESMQKIHNAEVLMEEWKQIAAEKDAPIITSWTSGKLVNSIQVYMEDHPIDFVVMGSHGASGRKEFFLGSNTQKVVRSIHKPVLIIKEELTSYRINKVVFASNFHTSERVPFQYLINFVKPFNPEIHLVQVDNTSWFGGEPYSLVKEAMDNFKKMCGTLTCKTHYFKDWTIDAGIRNLSENIGADLVAISNHNRHPLKRLFSSSNVEALVNHSNIPVLSIDLGDVAE